MGVGVSEEVKVQQTEFRMGCMRLGLQQTLPLPTPRRSPQTLQRLQLAPAEK